MQRLGEGSPKYWAGPLRGLTPGIVQGGGEKRKRHQRHGKGIANGCRRRKRTSPIRTAQTAPTRGKWQTRQQPVGPLTSLKRAMSALCAFATPHNSRGRSKMGFEVHPQSPAGVVWQQGNGFGRGVLPRTLHRCKCTRRSTGTPRSDDVQSIQKALADSAASVSWL